MSDYEELIERLDDLLVQATKERLYYYTGRVVSEAATAIRELVKERDDAIAVACDIIKERDEARALLRETLPFVEMELRWSTAHQHTNEAGDCQALVDKVNAALAVGGKR